MAMGSQARELGKQGGNREGKSNSGGAGRQLTGRLANIEGRPQGTGEPPMDKLLIKMDFC